MPYVHGPLCFKHRKKSLSEPSQTAVTSYGNATKEINDVAFDKTLQTALVLGWSDKSHAHKQFAC